MHYFTALASLVFFHAGSGLAGFTIPENHAPGVYSVSYDNAGQAIHTFLRGPANETERAAAAAKRNSLPRPFGRSDGQSCGGYNLNPGNTDGAVEALKRQCDPQPYITPGNDYYSYDGTTVAYQCDFGNSVVKCSRDELGDSYARITASCGLYRSGWRTIQTSDVWYSIGYEDSGSHFCGRGP